MVEFLVKQRAPHVEDVNGNTPLHCAALGGDPQVALLLLEGVPKSTLKYLKVPRNTLPYLGGDPQVAQLLLEGGADVEACNHEDDRPLHLAAGAGNLAVLRLLHQVGAKTM